MRALRVAILCSPFAFAACAEHFTTQNTVAGAETALTAAEETASAYKNLPTCGTAGVVVCSVPATVTAIKADDMAAYNAVKAAEAANGNATALSAAYAAIAALTAAVPAK